MICQPDDIGPIYQQKAPILKKSTEISFIVESQYLIGYG